MKKIIIMLVLALLPTLSHARDNHTFGVGLGLDFSEDAYEVDFNFTWYPVETFGLRVSLGAAGEYDDLFYVWEDCWGNEHYYYNDNDYAWRFKFSPSIELRSPALIKFSDRSNLRLIVNPGVTLSPGAAGSCNAKWFTWQVRGGIELNFGDFGLQLGYRCTNFYLYSGNPYSETDYEFDRDLIPDRYTHSGFISAIVRF